jgi:hypothetical protein
MRLAEIFSLVTSSECWVEMTMVWTHWGDWDSIDQLVLTRDLRLSIGANPVAGAVLAHLSSLEPKLVASMWIGVDKAHDGLSLVGGVAKHDPLVSGANVLDLDGVHALQNIGLCSSMATMTLRVL